MILGSSVRPVAEDCKQVAVRQVPAPGTRTHLRWPDGASATLQRDAQAVTIRYCWRLPAGNAERDGAKWQATAQTIGLVFDTPHFGGVRRFWQCPMCKHGARKLYASDDGRFACKRCLRLAHRSQRQKTWRRALARAAKIRSYLASNSSPADPFPERPKRMRRAVYDGLRAEVERLEALPAEAWVTDGRHVALGIRRSATGARRWWPARNHRAG